MTTAIRTARAALLMLAALTACASTASAARPQYDPSYERILRGTATSEKIMPTQCEAFGNKTIAISGQAGGLGRPHSKETQHNYFMFDRPNQKAKPGWTPAPTKRGEQLIASDLSTRHRNFTYVTSPVLDKRSTTFVVRQKNSYLFDTKFKDVKLSLPPVKRSETLATSVNVLDLDGGQVLVVIDRADAQRIYRFTSTGKPANFGTNGVVTISRTGPAAWFLPAKASTPLLETYDGSLLVGASGRPGKPEVGDAIGLLKLDKQGKVVEGFGDRGLWTPPATVSGDRPLDGFQKRLAPQALAVIGGTSPERKLTVLFGTKTSEETGTSVKIASAQLTENGVPTAVSDAFDQATDAGDGGFPDAQPFDFASTATGIRYASGSSEFAGGNFAYLNGNLIGLTALLVPPVMAERVHTEDRFIAFDFAATPDGKYVYACGAIARGAFKSNRPWTRYVPALRRFKL